MMQENGGSHFFCNVRDHSGEEKIMRYVTDFGSSSLIFNFLNSSEDMICINCIPNKFYSAFLK
jgi:hypothetical protein